MSKRFVNGFSIAQLAEQSHIQRWVPGATPGAHRKSESLARVRTKVA